MRGMAPNTSNGRFGGWGAKTDAEGSLPLGGMGHLRWAGGTYMDWWALGGRRSLGTGPGGTTGLGPGAGPGPPGGPKCSGVLWFMYGRAPPRRNSKIPATGERTLFF